MHVFLTLLFISTARLIIKYGHGQIRFKTKKYKPTLADLSPTSCYHLLRGSRLHVRIRIKTNGPYVWRKRYVLLQTEQRYIVVQHRFFVVRVNYALYDFVILWSGIIGIRQIVQFTQACPSHILSKIMTCFKVFTAK